MAVTGIWRPVAVYASALLPFIESRGSVLLARVLNLPVRLSSALSIAGSYTPVPFLLYAKKSPKLQSIKKKEPPENVRRLVRQYGCWALLVLIAMPFTGLGCWLGAIIARAMRLDRRKSAVSIFIGNAIAVLLMTGCLSGVCAAAKGLLGLL